MPKLFAVGAILGLATVLQACAVDTYFDCRNLCQRYQDCIDDSVDIDRCTSRCESNVESGEDDAADVCDECLNDSVSCAERVIRCSIDCAPLLR